MKKKSKLKLSDMRNAYICECGAVRPIDDPNGMPMHLILAMGGVNDAICFECKKIMQEVKGSWMYQDVKEGIWPFRKVIEKHWTFVAGEKQ